MTQNTSTAVMAQRREDKDSLDFYPTPPWAARALVEHVLSRGPWSGQALRTHVVWEPACGAGDLVLGLEGYFERIWASDVYDHGCQGAFLNDFLFPGMPWMLSGENIDWVITNPPFRLAAEFIDRGLGIARQGVAMLVRTSFIEGIERYHTLFSIRPPVLFAPFVERVPMVRGRVDEDASSATSYSWLVWSVHTAGPPAVRWIPPCRQSLERDGDYTAQPTDPAPTPLFDARAA